MAQLIKGVVDTQIENLIPIGSTNAGDDTVIELSIKSNGQDFIFNNPTFELLSKKEDNTKTRQIKDITLLDGKVKIKADIQLTLCKGIVTNQLIINDGDKISTVYFYFMVNPSLENEVLEESKDKIESLDKLDKLINTSFSDLEAYENKLLAFSAEMDSIVEVESKREANELIRSTSEVKRIYNEDSRIISEEDRIANEAIRVEKEEARGLAESERVTNENNRRLAENTRKTQENARVAAEEQRQSIFEENENIRKEQEGKRVQAESVRKNKFNTWEEREGLRLISEDQRREAEESRQLAESNRDKAEKAREQQEANREATYNNFNNAEEERVNNESSRKDKENLRALAENSRVAAEKERVAAENTRNSRYETAESNRNNTFNSNENKRQSDYESNEGTRNSTFEAEERKRKNSYQDAENTRNNSFNQQEENRQNAYTAAERLRVENENLRKNNEATRGSNEETRKTNETSRVSAENIRVENEKTRVAAEEERQANFEKFKTDNTTFKEEVKAQYEDIVRENETFKSEVNAKTGNCEEGYFDGKVYPTLKDRLDFDFEDVNRRLLEAELLGYEGSIMKCDSTYSGLTSDLEIKGRTLQNLLLDNTFENTTTVDGGWKATRLNIAFDLKANTDYLLIYTVSKNSNNYSLNIGGKIDNAFSVMGLDSSIGTHKVIIKTYSDITDKKMNKLFFQYLNTIAGEIKVTNIMLLEYSINLESLPIEYFEGIKSVGEQEKIGDKYKVGIKSYGKNLLDIEKFKNVENHNNVPKTELATFNKCFLIKNTKPNTKYTICRTSSAVGTVNVSILNSDGSRASLTSGTSTNRTIETSSDGLLYIAIQSVTQERITTALSESGELWLEEGAIPTPYEPYQSDTKYLLVDEPLRSLLNGVSDTIDELGVETKRVGKIILDGSENWGFSVEQENTIRFYISNRTGKTSFGYCDTLTYRASGMPHGDYEYILINPTNIFINIAKSKLTTQDVEGVKNWLQTNNTTLIHELAEPIVINHNKNLNLKTYEGTTYISSENTLKANISCKVPSNVQAVLQDTRARNRELENELETTTLKLKEADNILKEMDTDLIKTNWEMDDRLFEVEWALEDAGLVTSVSTFNINNKMRGSASVMALSKFEQAKIIIMSGDYDRATLEGQLSKYLKRNIIAQDEYDTLISMMDAKEIVVGE